MSSEKFCLRWNDFERNISHAFQELREDKDFFDVTIACDDEQMKAHKVILAACSPFFKTILLRNKHEHPLLYLKGVKCVDLVSVLSFMYHGEVNVAQEDLNSFLSVAEDLKVKGLTQNESKPGPSSAVQHENSKDSPRDTVTNLTPRSTRYEQPMAQHSNRIKAVSKPREVIDINEVNEIVPVKSEPLLEDQSYLVSESQELVNNDHLEENYLDYSAYTENDHMTQNSIQYSQDSQQPGGPSGILIIAFLARHFIT